MLSLFTFSLLTGLTSLANRLYYLLPEKLVNREIVMTVWKGGRGDQATYKTTHVRIPVEIKQQVEALSEAYRKKSRDYQEGKLKMISSELVVSETSEIDKQIMIPNQLSLDEAVEMARQILKRKKSARVSMKSLLTGIYGEEISL